MSLITIFRLDPGSILNLRSVLASPHKVIMALIGKGMSRSSLCFSDHFSQKKNSEIKNFLDLRNLVFKKTIQGSVQVLLDNKDLTYADTIR